MQMANNGTLGRSASLRWCNEVDSRFQAAKKVEGLMFCSGMAPLVLSYVLYSNNFIAQTSDKSTEKGIWLACFTESTID